MPSTKDGAVHANMTNAGSVYNVKLDITTYQNHPSYNKRVIDVEVTNAASNIQVVRVEVTGECPKCSGHSQNFKMKISGKSVKTHRTELPISCNKNGDDRIPFGELDPWVDGEPA